MFKNLGYANQKLATIFVCKHPSLRLKNSLSACCSVIRYCHTKRICVITQQKKLWSWEISVLLHSRKCNKNVFRLWYGLSRARSLLRVVCIKVLTLIYAFLIKINHNSVNKYIDGQPFSLWYYFATKMFIDIKKKTCPSLVLEVKNWNK